MLFIPVLGHATQLRKKELFYEVRDRAQRAADAGARVVS